MTAGEFRRYLDFQKIRIPLTVTFCGEKSMALEAVSGDCQKNVSGITLILELFT
jgi:hypothetical protein